MLVATVQFWQNFTAFLLSSLIEICCNLYMYIVLLAKFYNLNNEIESWTLSMIIGEVLVDGGCSIV